MADKYYGKYSSWLNTYDKPKWREEFELRIGELEMKSGIDRNDLFRFADLLEELKIIRL